MKNDRLARYILLTAFLGGCGSQNKVPDIPVDKNSPVASIEAKEVAVESGTPFVAEVQFAAKQTQLPKTAVDNIEQVLETAKKHGPISECKILVWGDSEYPSVNTQKLSPIQIKLAESRGKVVAARLKKFGVGETEILNMAERPNTIQEWWGSADTRLKNALEVAGIPNTDTSIKFPSKRSHAIVIVLNSQNAK